VRKKQKQHFTVIILVIFEGNKTHLALEMNSTSWNRRRK